MATLKAEKPASPQVPMTQAKKEPGKAAASKPAPKKAEPKPRAPKKAKGGKAAAKN